MFSWIRHYVAEVCAAPSALLVSLCIWITDFTLATAGDKHPPGRSESLKTHKQRMRQMPLTFLRHFESPIFQYSAAAFNEQQMLWARRSSQWTKAANVHAHRRNDVTTSRRDILTVLFWFLSLKSRNARNGLPGNCKSTAASAETVDLKTGSP